jgi:pimeloyl-ACP methyl ester carboxylesterase
MPVPMQLLANLRAALTATTFAAVLAVAPSVRADTVSVADMVRGTTKTSAQCAVIPQAAWVTAMGRGYCMRYYLAEAAGEQRRPIVFLQGDRLGILNLRTGAFSIPDSEKDINTDNLMAVAVALSKSTKTTAIYLARVGVEGSSGDHRVRHSVLELNATNAALEAIRQQYHFEGFHLIGQSGGAHLVAGLLALRQDIGCAVIGSGPLAPGRRRIPPVDPALEIFNPASSVAAIARNRTPRIMVITDPADKKVGAEKQTEFVRLLQQAGRPVEQYIVQAIDENHHGVVAYSRVALSGCLKDESKEEIAQKVDKLVAQRVAASKPKVEKPNDGSRDAPISPGETQTHENIDRQ